MALRSSWEGFLKLSLISVPVRAYNAAQPGGGDIHFHQIHKECGNRIRYAKMCPVHGEVTKEEIVSGHEYEKGKYVELEKEELANLRAKGDDSINIDAFVSPDSIDPIYLSGRTFYLVPDGPAGQKPYQLLHDVMKQKKRYAVAVVVISGHEEAVLIRPQAKLLTMTVLYYEHQIKKTSAFEDEVGDTKITDQERKLAETLVDASTTKKVDFSQYTDKYTERVQEAIEAKLAGRKITTPRGEKHPGVINLMDALRQSLKKTGSNKKAGPRTRGAGTKHRTQRRRKTA